MKTLDLIATAVTNTFRSKTRTILTILAIFVGAFTLTITNGLGTGINNYIDSTVASFGASDVMTVTKATEQTDTGSGPAEYDPDTVASGQAGPPGTGGTVAVMTPDDLDTIAAIEGVERVEPVRSLSVDYIQFDGGTKFSIGAGSLVAGQEVQLAAGAQPDAAADAPQLTIPVDYVDALGFSRSEDAVGQTVTLAVTDGTGTQHTVEAEIVGVAEETFSLGTGGGSLLPNDALSTSLYDLQNTGVSAEQLDRYAQVRVWVASDATAEEIAAVQERLSDAGYQSTTIEDMLGAFTTVIDGIVLVLNAFAIIALLAASFGIVNTLLMSVQERTREIGLMKAMGMGSGRVFTLFSLEAAFIGLLGSAIGVGIAIIAGTAISGALGQSLLADLPGLQVIAFDPASIVITIVAVMVIAFLAGTLPAARAARQDPVESLRYE